MWREAALDTDFYTKERKKYLLLKTWYFSVQTASIFMAAKLEKPN